MNPTPFFPRKLSKAELARIGEVLALLTQGTFDVLQIKKIKEQSDHYRVRVGNLRIIYRVTKSGDIVLLAIRKRDEQTYRGF